MKAETEVQKTLAFGERRIPYLLARGQRKRVRILVTPDMHVMVSAPALAKDEQIESVVRKRAGWIARTLDGISTFHPLPAPKRYESGETVVYLGRQYRLKVEQGDPLPALLRGRFLHVCVRAKGDAVAVRRAVDNWYRARARETFERCMAKCAGTACRHGVPAAEIQLRTMRTRWGSCSGKGRITLNTSLVQAPVHCIEYVIMHELCHLRHHDHSGAFYRLLSLCMPDWSRRKDALHRMVLPPSGRGGAGFAGINAIPGTSGCGR